MAKAGEFLKNSLIGITIALVLLAIAEGMLWVFGVEPTGDMITVTSRFDRDGAALDIPRSSSGGFAPSVIYNMSRSPFMQPDRKLIFRGRANRDGRRILGHNGINALGFRGRNPERAERLTGARRLLVLGDSCAFGWGVPEVSQTFPVLLERLLSRATGQRWTVYNLGQPGHSTEQGVRLYEQWVDRIRPDVVVLYYGWNDVWPTPMLTDRQTMTILEATNRPVLRALTSLRVYAAVEFLLAPFAPEEQTAQNVVQHRGRDRVPEVESIENIRRMTAKQPSVVVLPGYASGGKAMNRRIERFNTWTRRAFEGQLPLVAPKVMTPDSPTASRYFIRDRFHPNPLGARVIANELASQIVKHLVPGPR